MKIFDEKNNTEENIEKVDEILRRKKIAGESLEKIKLFFREDVFKDVDAETLINKK